MSTKSKILIHNYNEGASAGRYALNNLSNAGKFANFVHAIPQRFVLSGSGASLILKRGSMVPILNGTSGNSCIYQVIPADLVANYGKQIKALNSTFKIDPALYQYVVYNVTKNKLEWGPYSNYTYTSATNLFTNKVGEKCSCPLGIVDANGMLKPFSGISFCGYFIFVDMGTEYDCPSGLNYAGRQKENHVFVPAMKVSEITSKKNNTHTGSTVLLDEYGAATISHGYEMRKENSAHSDYLYCVEDNYTYSASNAIVNLTKVAKIDLLEGLVKNIYEFNYFFGTKLANDDSLKEISNDLEKHVAEENKMHEDINNVLVALDTRIAKYISDFENIKPTLNEKTGEFTWDGEQPEM